MSRQPFDDFCDLLSSAITPNGADEHRDVFAKWSPEHWEAIIALASNHLVLPSIAVHLPDDIAARAIDPQLHGFFKEIRDGNTKRNRDLLHQVDHICALANSLGIRPILLKGAAHLAEDVYGDLGARYMLDIDILVDRDERDRLQQAMEARGYAALVPKSQGPNSAGMSFWDDHHHAPPMLDPDEEFVVEVHSDTLTEGGEMLDLDYRGLSGRALDRERDAVHFRVPCIEDRVVHCIAHHQLGHNERFIGTIEMRDLLDLHFLTVRGPCSDEQWADVLQRFDRAGHGNLALGFLNALKTMVPSAELGPCPAGGLGARWQKAHYLRRHRRWRLGDPTIFSDIMAREWHRLSAFKTYRQQLRANFGDVGYWRHRWQNLLRVIRGS